VATVRSPHYPVQIVWGARDTALSWRHHGVQAQLAAGLNDAILLPASTSGKKILLTRSLGRFSA
jgi:hypothetical protein